MEFWFKMAQLMSYLCLLAVVLVNSVDSNLFYTDGNSPSRKLDRCTSECVSRARISSNAIGNGRGSCLRGCRFYIIVQMIDDGQILDQNSSQDACKSSCKESYGANGNVESSWCMTGCEISTNISLKDEIIEVPLVPEVWPIFVDSENSMQILQGDMPEPDDPVLLDPGLHGQLAQVHTLHIPEMRVRTLPVSAVKEEGMSGWWGGCGSGRGVPHCLAASLLLLLILLALWFGLSLEDPRSPSNPSGTPGGSSDDIHSSTQSHHSKKLIPPPPPPPSPPLLLPPPPSYSDSVNHTLLQDYTTYSEKTPLV